MKILLRTTILSSVLLLTACGGVGGAVNLEGRSNEWPALGTSRSYLVETLGKADEVRYTMDGGNFREIMTWIYSRVDQHPLMYVPVIGMLIALSGEGATGEQRTLTVELDETGRLVSKQWINEVLHWEPFTNAPVFVKRPHES